MVPKTIDRGCVVESHSTCLDRVWKWSGIWGKVMTGIYVYSRTDMFARMATCTHKLVHSVETSPCTHTLTKMDTHLLMETDTDKRWYNAFETDSLKLACWNCGFEIIVGYLFSTLHHIPRNTQCVPAGHEEGLGITLATSRGHTNIYIYVCLYMYWDEKQQV